MKNAQCLWRSQDQWRSQDIGNNPTPPGCLAGCTRPDRPGAACRGSRVQAGKGISGAVPAIGNELGRAILPVVSAALVAAPDIAHFLTFPA